MIGRHTVWTVRHVIGDLGGPAYFLILGTLGTVHVSVSVDAESVLEGKDVFCAAMLAQDKLMQMAVNDNFECLR